MITIVTGSSRKKQEINEYIDNRIQYQFIEQDLDEIQGTSTEIIQNKLKTAHKLVKGPVVVEDYSLYIDKLCGFPGPYVKSVLRNGELSKIVNNLAPLGELKCTAECLYGYIDESDECHIFSTKVNGVLIPATPVTDGLFGVDHILIQENTSVPFFYLTKEEKNKNSIRRKTINQLIEHLEKEKKIKEKESVKNILQNEEENSLSMQ
ncbi:inosine triphosphate pyrophosphatase [Nematocida sp. AWRm78]|nr:inosine triphosphate pyrophosphatase [Nematocida sp. AWRm79]KAI5183151.1 inosine triphosphate pyrophosphatase [Nematocida sp. AWRm78]